MRKDHDATITAIIRRRRSGFSAVSKKTSMLGPYNEGNDKDVLFFNCLKPGHFVLVLIINTSKEYRE